MAHQRVVAPAAPAELNLDLAGWYRRGGRRCGVHVTAEEFAAAVRDGLIGEFGPWRLTGSDATAGADGGRVEHPWVADEVALDRFGHEPSGVPRTNMWVWSPRLTRSRVWRRIARRLRKAADRPGPSHGHPLFDGYPWSAAALTEALAAMDHR